MSPVVARMTRWWLNKRVARIGSSPITPPQECVRLDFVGPPSFAYGTINFHLSDGSSVSLRGTGSHRPRKRDVAVVGASSHG